jgi:hypothetical protein
LYQRMSHRVSSSATDRLTLANLTSSACGITASVYQTLRIQQFFVRVDNFGEPIHFTVCEGYCSFGQATCC